MKIMGRFDIDLPSIKRRSIVLTWQEYESILLLLNEVQDRDEVLIELPTGAFKRAVNKIKNAAVVY